MSEPLPASGLASDLQIPRTPLESYVDSQAPSAAAPRAAKVHFTELLLFQVGDGAYALPVARLREVTRAQGIARVPLAPEHVRGIHSVRGVMVPVVELRTRLGLPATEVTPASRLLVAEARGRLLALLVDSVARVQRVREEDIRPPPPELAGRISPHVRGVVAAEGRLALVLDLDGVLALRDGAATPSAVPEQSR